MAKLCAEGGTDGRLLPRTSICSFGFVSVAVLQCGSVLLSVSSSLGLLAGARAGDAFAACPASGPARSSAPPRTDHPDHGPRAPGAAVASAGQRAALPGCAALAPGVHGDKARLAQDGVLFSFWPRASFGREFVRELDAYLAPDYHRPRLPRWGRREGQPDRVSFGDYQRLAPSDGTAQGPHQENMPGDPDRTRARVVVFACEEPAESGGATALFDMRRAWLRLPADLQALLRGSSFEFPMLRGGWQASPCVLEDDLGAPALQFYGFGGLARESVERYRQLTGSGAIPDPHSYGVHPTRGVLLVNNTDDERSPFEGELLRRVVASIYESMVVHRWARGEVLIVDNLRWAHARLEGAGAGRKINFVIYSRT